MIDATLLEPIISAIGSLSEPVIKLIETVERGVGGIARPHQTERMAQAEARAAIIRLGAELEMKEMADRAAERLAFRELRRQRHIESIIAKAASQLPESVSSEPVDEDWVTQFFNYSQDVSNDEMQMLWARLLAGEVQKPGSFSLRTLQVTRLLQASDATAFRQACNYVWDQHMVAVTDNTRGYLESRGLTFTTFLELQSAGLLSQADSAWTVRPGAQEHLTYFDKKFLLAGPREDYLGCTMGTSILSRAGEELMTLCDLEPDDEYLTEMTSYWTTCGVRWRILTS